MHLPPRGVTRQRCGLLTNYFGHLFHDVVLVHYCPFGWLLCTAEGGPRNVSDSRFCLANSAIVPCGYIQRLRGC